MDGHSRERVWAVKTLAEPSHQADVRWATSISCCTISCSLLPRALQEPAPEQEALGLQEPQAPLPPQQQVSEDTEAVRGQCAGVVESVTPGRDIGLPVPGARD